MYRQDPVTKKWVIFAPHRAKRPKNGPHVQAEIKKGKAQSCPFCAGPDGPDRKVFQVKGSGKNWQQYVLANKYPAVQTALEPVRHKNSDGRLSIEGFGISEVLVETPSHHSPLYLRDASEVKQLFKLYKERAIERLGDPRVTQVIIFKNCGPKAGASQPHPHSQLYALPIVPGHIRFAADCYRRFYDDEGFCPVCLHNKSEIESDKRVIYNKNKVLAICPYASENAYEVHLFPQEHFTSLTLIEDNILESMADATRTILKAHHEILGKFDYNLVWDSAPQDDCDAPFFHLRLRIIPRLSTPAGFEMASQMPVNPCLPEKAAKELKEAIKKGKQ